MWGWGHPPPSTFVCLVRCTHELVVLRGSPNFEKSNTTTSIHSFIHAYRRSAALTASLRLYACHVQRRLAALICSVNICACGHTGTVRVLVRTYGTSTEYLYSTSTGLENTCMKGTYVRYSYSVRVRTYSTCNLTVSLTVLTVYWFANYRYYIYVRTYVYRYILASGI